MVENKVETDTASSAPERMRLMTASEVLNSSCNAAETKYKIETQSWNVEKKTRKVQYKNFPSDANLKHNEKYVRANMTLNCVLKLFVIEIVKKELKRKKQKVFHE